ncbi:MAG: iron ABC transporter permease, partial [Clostridia bacterium]|nr:iron ABC transporter permease [Clostridia bacterium]
MSHKKGKYRTTLFVTGSVLLLVSAFVISLSYGSVAIPFDQTVRLLVSRCFGLGKVQGISESFSTILTEVRLPRVILAGLVGAALSIAGAAMQGLLKNPLADGSTLGVTAGGALGAVLSIVLGINLPFFPQGGLALMSIAFSFLSLMVILTLSY